MTATQAILPTDRAYLDRIGGAFISQFHTNLNPADLAKPENVEPMLVDAGYCLDALCRVPAGGCERITFGFTGWKQDILVERA